MQLIKEATSEKLRGGFYTPAPIASFILKWAFNGNKQCDILEPSCGDGMFLQQIREGGYEYNSLFATELDTEESEKASAHKIENCVVENREFHEFCNSTERRFDLVIGNPPFIRYQYFNKEQQEQANIIFKRAELKYSMLTNSWVSFIVGSSLLLKETGKIGFVVPAEILQVSFAKTLRQFLAHFYNKINIVSFEKLVFPDIQQEVVLLLCEKDKTEKHFIEHIEVEDAKGLLKLDVAKLRSPKKKIDFKSNKWTFYFLEQDEIDFIEKIKIDKRLKKLGQLSKVEVGITTGANPFFTVPKSTVQFYQLDDFAKPMVGRSVQVSSAIFTEKDWQQNQNIEARSNLLVFPKKENLNGHNGAREYIAFGEEQGINKGYKCRIRDEWQIVPSLWVSDALFVRRNNLYPKFLINDVGAYTTDTMHRVRINSDINKKALVASYYNSMTLAFTEICGRSHGGGVLELMPNEVESIVIPYSEQNEKLLETIDGKLRNKESIHNILKFTDEVILKGLFNFSDKEISLANSIWKKLSNRRLNRGK
jgi:adenine-specific DNA-methyltransferase